MHTVSLAPNVGFSGLSEGTAYDVYLVAQDIAGNYQSSVTKLDVTTTSVIPATLTVSVTGSAPGSYYEIGTYSKITDDYMLMVSICAAIGVQSMRMSASLSQLPLTRTATARFSALPRA